MEVVVIPAYEPEGILVSLTRELKEKEFEIVVVDDGSGQGYSDIFEEIKEYATVIHHKKNKGKGAALKTGIRYIKENLPECKGFITCDADGQHKISDVERIREALSKGEKFVLTVRTPKKGIPFRSKVGNNLSRFVYTLLTNRYFSDNQSGLRGFSREHIDWLLKVEKNNYDYEMNVLFYAAKKNIYITTIEIEALYINNNASSHFSPLIDTVRIYKSLFSLAIGTIIGFTVAEILAVIISYAWSYSELFITLPGIGAISYLVSIVLNKYVIFKNTPCYDYWAMLIYTVINYFVYTLCCALIGISIPNFPLWASFNITYILCLPLRYYLHKFIFVASRRKR